MGMIGYYMAVEPEIAAKVKNNEITVFDYKADEQDSLDIDKSWHALYYTLSLMSADNDDLKYAVPMCDEAEIQCDSEFPVFVISSSQTAQAAKAVSGITKDTLLQNYHFSEMSENCVYPIMSDEGGDEFFEYIYAYFADIQKFLSKAASEDKAIIFYIA